MARTRRATSSARTGVAARQVGGELVAAEAREHVAVAQRDLQPAAGLAQQRIARLVPVAVVDELEAVDVDEQHGARRRAAPRQLPLELARELGAVDEAGERIVLRGVRELELRQLALGDIGEDSLEAGRAVLTDDPASLIPHPHDVPVAVQEAVLVVEQPGHLGIALVAHDLRAIVRVDALQPQRRVGHPLRGRVSEHRLDLRADVEAATRHPRLPAVRRHRHALDQRLEALFAELLGGDVVHESSRARAGACAHSLSAAGTPP